MLIWGLFSEVCIRNAEGNPAQPTTHDGDMADMAGGPKHPPAKIIPKTSIHLIDVDLGLFSEVCIRIAKGNPAQATTHDVDMAGKAKTSP